MATIQDYFNPKMLQHMQETFSTAVGAPVYICAPDGQPALPADVLAGGRAFLTAPIRVEGTVIGQLTLQGPPAPAVGTDSHSLQWVADFLKLMAAMIASLCGRQRTVRLRVEELSTLYHLTAEFAGQRDLQSVLDTVTHTVVNLFEAKSCTIRLLNEDAQTLVVKAANNIDDENLVRGPIPLAESKIDHEAITTGHVVYIPDLEKDARVLFPDGARAEGLVSALCVPLVYRGRPLGVIRIYTAEAYIFDRFEYALMSAVAAQAAAAIVNAELQAEAIRGETIKRQLRLAGDVQLRMFPRERPSLPGIDVAADYRACFELGGDFYDFIDLADGSTGIVVCDVVGKGVRASLLMATIRAALRAHAANIGSVSDVLQRVNSDLCAVTEVADFATLFYGAVDPDGPSITFANAGHPSPLLFRSGEVIELAASGGMLGVTGEWAWPSRTVDLQTGDVLVAYTDGLTEVLNFDDEAFGQHRVEQAVAEAIGQDFDTHDIIGHVLWHHRNFAGLQTRSDDLTIVAIKVQ
ncbi:MAG: PP2C family protein-serine/threonine phosphatase [Planctomycetota bacterium]